MDKNHLDERFIKLLHDLFFTICKPDLMCYTFDSSYLLSSGRKIFSHFGSSSNTPHKIILWSKGREKRVL